MAAFIGKDVNKLKAKGGGKWKYISEQEMVNFSQKFAPYRSLSAIQAHLHLSDISYRSVFMWYMWRIEGVDVSAVEQM